ncbi:hypothetical protein KXD93_08345 [Mucilaginibacter sp. BJC16-A38]|uniref:DUF5908 family protein n=1 Tax=Mucilaginibacter phenanthrenivorans TaxID=1234842 RepID=UPI002157F146|nr:DUF5908 family protein [Mucilaginibacter phenanthrenivorans]MCR8557649.1 hypothetical protein [Mucilaginibacter phenanthrenivorans]MDP9075931.1 DUF5908 family protein [Bacteroidota bacterium]
MPVEIRELQIITTVQDSGGKSSSGSAGSPGNSDDIVAKCVEQVLEILKEKTER